jgi:hypothetical protein
VSESGRYMYAIGRKLTAEELADTPGLAGARLEVVQHRDLSAVVSTVDLGEYGEEALRRNLERLDWLEETARRHEQVVRAVAAAGPVAPLRLATICLDDDAVRARLDEWYLALDQALDRVEGRSEWSVKAIASTESAGTPDAVADPAPAGRGSGAAYLQRKKQQSEQRAAGEERALAAAEGIHAGLSAVAVASRRLRPQDPRLSGHQGSMILNGAYLVEVGREEAFQATVEELQAAHPDLVLDVGGPWPPYSFATLEQG